MQPTSIPSTRTAGWQEETIDESPRSKHSTSKPAQGSFTSTTSATDAASPSLGPPAFGSSRVAFALSKQGTVAAAPKPVAGGSKRANQLVAAAAAAKKVKKVHIAGKVNVVQIGPVLPNGSFVRHSIGSPRPGAVPGPWKGSSASRTQFKPSTSKRGASSSRKGQPNYGQQASSKSLAYSFTKVTSPQKKPGSYTVPSRPSSSNP